MRMKLYVVAQLLSATNGLLYSGYLALSLSVLAILLKGWQSFEFWIAIIFSLILSLAHHYLSFRIKFDAELMMFIAKYPESASIEQLTQEFDHSLLTLQLMPESKAGRDWTLRFKGCFRLIKLQIALLLLQYFVLIILIYKLLAQ